MRILDAFKTLKDRAADKIRPYLGKGYVIHFSSGKPVLVGGEPDAPQATRYSPMVGMNPHFGYEGNPVGIYGYDLDFCWDRYKVEETGSFYNFPYASNRQYIHVLKFKPSANVLDSRKFSFSGFNKYLSLLAKNLDSGKYGDLGSNYEQKNFERYADQVQRGDSPLRALWQITKYVAGSIWFRNRKRSVLFIWTGVFLSLGIDALVDWDSIVHENEPEQIVIFNSRCVDEVAVVRQRGFDLGAEKKPNPFGTSGKTKYFLDDQDPEAVWAVTKKHPWVMKAREFSGYRISFLDNVPHLIAVSKNAAYGMGFWKFGTLRGGELFRLLITGGSVLEAKANSCMVANNPIVKDCELAGCDLTGGSFSGCETISGTVTGFTFKRRYFGPTFTGCVVKGTENRLAIPVLGEGTMIRFYFELNSGNSLSDIAKLGEIAVTRIEALLKQAGPMAFSENSKHILKLLVPKFLDFNGLTFNNFTTPDMAFYMTVGVLGAPVLSFDKDSRSLRLVYAGGSPNVGNGETVVKPDGSLEGFAANY